MSLPFTLALLAAAPLARTDSVIPATSPLLLWQGRTAADATAGTVSFDWLNVQATFTVQGATSVYATLNSTFWASAPPTLPGGLQQSQYPPAPLAAAAAGGRALQQAQFPKFGVYRTYVNGSRVQRVGLDGIAVLPGQAEHAIVTGLDPAAAHTVTLWYTTDEVFNSWPDLDAGAGCVQTLVGLRTDGAFAHPPPPRTRHLLTIGDSISSGNAAFLPCANASKCDSSYSYASRLGEAFHLNHTMLTASSKGLLHNCCDRLNVTVPVLANRTFAQNASAQWDWGAHPPFDVALIHLGTNDGGQSPPAVFSAAYLDLLLHVAARATHPAAPIFAAWGPNSATMAPWVAAAAAAANARGLNVSLIDLMAAELDGCGHPGVLGHPHMARIAAPIIASVTGWAFDAQLLQAGGR